MKIKDVPREDLGALERAVSVRLSHLQPVKEKGARKQRKHQHLKCPSGKRVYRDSREADRALRSIAFNRQFADMNGYGHRFKANRKYKCTQCNYLHLTSKRDITNPRYLNVA